ncbi:MAG TPA: 23S rRNA (guanosine(2251)-2'-O)-methyltransferase RlmB [Arenicellales bacterium]|nr:23S rRNA (guanosine(2251)-2'-O)-methyltransferase RlmB [Arenicellales bacterium]
MAQQSYLYGVNAVQTALERHPERVRELWWDARRQGPRVKAVLEQAQRAGVPAQPAGRETLDRLSAGARHQGVVARADAPRPLDEGGLAALLAGLTDPPFLLVLDGIQDPHNLGACLRSADAAGVHAVIAPRDRACSLTPVVRKVASGAAESVPLVQVTNLARSLRELKARGIWLVGTAGEVSAELFDTDLSGPLALVLGAEGKGLRRLTRDTCDHLVRLPMRGAVESLNVSVATGVCLYEALRQRRIEKRSAPD